MSDRETTSEIIDEILRYAVTGTALAASLALPGLIVGLRKPLEKFLSHLDTRERERELRRIIYKMREQGLLAGSYEHGLQLTQKARKRLDKLSLTDLHAQPVDVWDGRWRIILYDLPKNKDSGRHALVSCLRSYGCLPLQKSTWITPFPCRKDIETICAQFGVDTYVTYFEAVSLDNERVMIDLFRRKYPGTDFSATRKFH